MDNNDPFGYKVRAHLCGVIEILICGSIEDMGTMSDHYHTHPVVGNKPCKHRSGVEPSRNDASIPVAFQGLEENREDREKELVCLSHKTLKTRWRSCALATSWEDGVASNRARISSFLRSNDGADG